MATDRTSKDQRWPFVNESLAESLVAAADAALASSLLENLPVLGIGAKLLKAGSEIHDAFRFRKLESFLKAAGNASEAGREKIRKELGKPAGQASLGARLLVLIERAEDLEKPRILGRLLVAFAEGAYTVETLWRLSRMVERSHSEDLAYLSGFHTGPQPVESIVTVQCLAANGFLYQIGIDGGEWDVQDSGGMVFEISDLGQLLVKHGLDDQANAA